MSSLFPICSLFMEDYYWFEDMMLFWYPRHHTRQHPTDYERRRFVRNASSNYARMLSLESLNAVKCRTRAFTQTQTLNGQTSATLPPTLPLSSKIEQSAEYVIILPHIRQRPLLSNRNSVMKIYFYEQIVRIVNHSSMNTVWLSRPGSVHANVTFLIRLSSSASAVKYRSKHVRMETPQVILKNNSIFMSHY